MKKADVLRELGKDPKSSILSAYENGRSNPSYEICFKLLMLGMTPRELFGEEVDEKLRAFYLDSNDPKLPKDIDTPDMKQYVKGILLEMKNDGEI